MDAFFAAVEQRANPRLRGLPVIVGGLGGRGVVSTASYEARLFGVHSAMPMALARQLCPQGIFISPDHKRYETVSKQIMAILGGYSPVVEQVSIDEAFLDISGIKTREPDFCAYVRRLKKDIYEKTGLTASAGLAANKFLAKLASDYNKPDGFMLIRPESAEDFLAPLPVGKLPGVGKATEKILKSRGINTIGEFKQTDRRLLTKMTGRQTDALLLFSKGLDTRPVTPERDAKSVGRETTYDHDLFSLSAIHKELLKLSQETGWRLRHMKMRGLTLSLKIRYPSFAVITRSITHSDGFYYDEDIYAAVLRLCAKCDIAEGVRLLGVAVGKLERADRTIRLFAQGEEDERKQRRAEAVDSLKGRFGENIIMRGLTAEKTEKPGCKYMRPDN
jgi:DNA polymerase-4